MKPPAPPAVASSKYHRLLVDDYDNSNRNNYVTGRKMSNPLMDLLSILKENQQNGIQRSAACDDRSFCEISRLGQKEEADVLPKMLWKIAIE